MIQTLSLQAQPHKAETAREFYEQMELAAAAEGMQGFAMCRATFDRLVRESGNEWHKVPGLRHVFTLGPKDAPLLKGHFIALRDDIPPGKIARIAKTHTAPPPDAPPDADTTAMPSLYDGPLVVIRTPTEIILEKVREKHDSKMFKAGKGRRVLHA